MSTVIWELYKLTACPRKRGTALLFLTKGGYAIAPPYLKALF